MSRDNADTSVDDENPEWSAADFARALPPHEVLPPEILTQFRNTRQRGLQRAPTKKLVSIRLSQTVIDHFKTGGPGWQGRLDEHLRKSIER